MVGAPLDETFAIEGGHARWKSHEESGDKDLAAPAFFVPIADLPDTLGLLVQALIKAGGTLPLLPTGQAHAERVAETAITANGLAKHVTLYDVTGVDLLPIHVWMEDDGTWFGFIDPGFSVVPEGWEGVIDQLVAQQRQIEQERDQKLAERLRHTPPAAGLALTHARVLDVERGQWLKDFTVLVVGDTIKAVGPSKAIKAPAGAEVVDLAGKAVLPGLWDMHAHLRRADGALDIASGVTTVRDVGNDPDRLDDFKARFDSGAAIGPHVLRAGFIEGRGEKAASSKITGGDGGRGEGRRRVLRQARLRDGQDLQLGEARARPHHREGGPRARHDGDRAHPRAHAGQRGGARRATTASSTSTCSS